MVKGTLVLDDCEDRWTEEDLESCHLLINTTGVQLQLDTGDLLGGLSLLYQPTRAGLCLWNTSVPTNFLSALALPSHGWT